MNPPEPETERRPFFPAAVIVYGLLTLAAALWLYLRDRSEVLPGLALGKYGAFVSLGAGTVVGLGASGIFYLLNCYLRRFRELEERLMAVIGPLTEVEILGIALVSAVGEETFFRGAMQDLWGQYWAAVVFGLLHTGPGLLLWGLVALLLGLVFGQMVDFGLGLLSVTVAHALINFISLRRLALP